MIQARRSLATSDPDLIAGFEEIRTEFHVHDAFAPDVAAAALATAARGPVDPPGNGPRRDHRDLELVTIDPAGSRDLDQAYGAAAVPGGGFTVFYAIADVAAFVTAGDVIDTEARERGVTCYLPDHRSPLYPTDLSEGAASLLPDQDRPALLWTITLDAAGNPIDTRLERTTVRSRAALAYPEVQAQIDAGTAAPALMLLKQIGELRLALEAASGGVSIELPEQSVDHTDAGYTLDVSASLPVERWNAQISLLTGAEAARVMVAHGVGLLRTMPPPPQIATDRLRHAARILHVPWPNGATYQAVIRSVQGTTLDGDAFLNQAVHTFRGASYELVNANDPLPQTQAAVGSTYAHVTAPLRRIADRYVNEIVLALANGLTPPAWATDALPELPKIMERAGQRDHAVEHAVVDLIETALLEGRVGETFKGGVIDQRHDDASVVQLVDPPVIANVADTGHELGSEVTVRLDAAVVATRTLTFSFV